jgi:hypothetical protein
MFQYNDLLAESRDRAGMKDEGSTGPEVVKVVNDQAFQMFSEIDNKLGDRFAVYSPEYNKVMAQEIYARGRAMQMKPVDKSGKMLTVEEIEKAFEKVSYEDVIGSMLMRKIRGK